MEALEKVLDTIRGVLEIIMNFFKELFPKAEEDEATEESAE